MNASFLHCPEPGDLWLIQQVAPHLAPGLLDLSALCDADLDLLRRRTREMDAKVVAELTFRHQRGDAA